MMLRSRNDDFMDTSAGRHVPQVTMIVGSAEDDDWAESEFPVLGATTSSCATVAKPEQNNTYTRPTPPKLVEVDFPGQKPRMPLNFSRLKSNTVQPSLKRETRGDAYRRLDKGEYTLTARTSADLNPKAEDKRHCVQYLSTDEDGVNWEETIPYADVKNEIVCRLPSYAPFALGPTARQQLVTRLPKEPVESPFVEVMRSRYDPLRRLVLTVPDKDHFHDVADALDKKYDISKTVGGLRKKTVQAYLPNTRDQSMLISAGGLPQLEDEGKSAAVLFAPLDPMFFQNHKDELVGLRSFVKLETPAQTFTKIRSKDAEMTHVARFESVELAQKAAKLFEQFAKMAPVSHHVGAGGIEIVQEVVLLELEWQRRTAVRIGKAKWMTDEDLTKMEDLLSEYGLHARNTWRGQLVVKPSHEDGKNHLDPDYIRNILIANGYTPNDLLRWNYEQQYMPRDENIQLYKDVQFAISKRLLMHAINRGWWRNVPMPELDSEFRKELEQAPTWTVNVMTERQCDLEQKNRAFVTFETMSLGANLGSFIYRMTPDASMFKLNAHDHQGVRTRCIFRTVLAVPNTLRQYLDGRLHELDEQWRAASYEHLVIEDAMETQWAYLEDLATAPECAEHLRTDQCCLAINAFPRDYAAECVRVVRELFDGEKIDCREDGKEFLLTGFGRVMVERELANCRDVLGDIDILGKTIILFGEREPVQRLNELFHEFARCRNWHQLEATIDLYMPSYLEMMGPTIEKVGIERIRKLLGGRSELSLERALRPGQKHRLHFRGPLKEHRILLQYLADIDDKLRQCREELPPFPSTDICPICACRVDVDFYCLDACGHNYCLPCIVAQLSNALKAKELPLMCMHKDCDEPFCIDDILRLLLGPRLLRHLDAPKLAPLIAACREQLLRDHTKYFRCPNNDCNHITVRDKIPPGFTSLPCPACEVVMCTKCGLEEHRSFSCQLYAQMRMDPTASLAQYVASRANDIRSCPARGCMSMIEKTEGCNHVQCPECKIHYCWVCLYNAEFAAEIYKHMSDIHGGHGGGWNIVNGVILEAPPEEQDILELQMLQDVALFR